MRNMLFILVSLVFLAACTQKQAEVVEDIVAEAPDKVNTVFENDFVRVDHFMLKPGDSLPLHKGGQRAVYALSDYTIKWTEGEKVSEKSWKKGDIHWHDSLAHAAENIGDTGAEYLVLTRKDAALPETEDYDISQDASQLDSAHAKIILDNAHLRVIEVKLPAGDSQAMHQGINRLIYSLSSYQIKYTSDQMESKEMQMEEGEFHWHGADQHAVENIGETLAHYLIFEFKK